MPPDPRTPAPSIIHAAADRWPARLRAQALAPPAVDRQAVLDCFRRHSAYYRERIDSARCWGDIPPLEKADIADVPVTDAPDLKDARSSGTSGVQVTIRNTRIEREFRRALLYRPQLFYELPDDIHQLVFVDGRWCATADTPPKRFRYGRQRYSTWFAGVAADPDEIRTLLRAIRPSLVRGISSGIVRFVEEIDAPLSDFGVQIVAPGGEFLLPEWRERMQSAFDADVFDRYGSTESGAIAWQCPHCGHYHANTDEIIIEADPEGVLVTPLFITSQPLLRYRLGDIVQFDDQATDCPIGLPTLHIEQARRDDWIIGADGQRISPLSFQFEQVSTLRAWRLHQHVDGSLKLYFDAGNRAAAAAQLARQMASLVPGQPVELIEGVWRLNRGGKFKRVSSERLSPVAGFMPE